MQLARIGILLAGLFSLCSSPILSQTTDYAIGDRDILSITVWSQMDLSGKYTVDADGTVTFPLVGAVKVQGLTVQQAAAELRNRLKDGFFQDPQLTVSIDDYRSQRIFVMGQVRQPGSYPLSGGMTVIEALARAGSTTADAPPEALMDGDTIFVPRAETVFVSGQVRSPGAYPIGKTTTVLQALTLAGGVTDRGATNRVRVIRIANGAREQVKVKLQDVLKPGDTVVVPERFF
jgi:polysaccharide export outer membrane protein